MSVLTPTAFRTVPLPGSKAELKEWCNTPLLPSFPINAGLHNDSLNEILLAATDAGASDIRLKTGDYPAATIAGYRKIICQRRLNVEDTIFYSEQLGGTGADGRMRSGSKVDRAYSARRQGEARSSARRWRMNLSSCHAERGSNGRGVLVVSRTIPLVMPTCEELQVEQEILDAFNRPSGFNIVGGPTGSGKTTLNSALIEREGQNTEQSIEVISVEAPIEYVYQTEKWLTSSITQIDVTPHDGHLAGGMTAGVENAMRQHPDKILIGEAVSLETMRALLLAAMSGHQTMTTMHVTDAGNFLQRMINTFPMEERGSQLINLMNVLRMVVVQNLFPSTSGGKVAIREFIVIDEDLRREILRAEFGEWTRLITEAVERRGRSMYQGLCRAADEGQIPLHVVDNFRLQSAARVRNHVRDTVVT